MARRTKEELSDAILNFDPTDFSLFDGLDVPDPITFVLGPQWLNQQRLYPRQATLLKIIFLRDDLFTDYDNAVIDEWERNFLSTGNNGISPGIRERIRINKRNDRRWFREVLLVMGRRAGKGHVSALAMAYILWNYMAKGDPQEAYQIAGSKKLECLIYAGKKEQARKNLYADLVNAIVDGPCFSPYTSRPLGESMSIFAPADKLKIAARRRRGQDVGFDEASFVIYPKEATTMSGRGGASFILGFDEMAHVVAAGSNRSAEEIYSAASPSLDQFRPDDFIIEPSSPWQMTGQFYQNYQYAIEMGPDDNEPVYPSMFMLQLASWDIYKDWEIAHTIDAFPLEFEGDLGEYLENPIPRYPKLNKAYQTYDEDMKRLQNSNPDTFKVERLSHWAATQDAYLNDEKIASMWQTNLRMTTQGRLNRFYKAHADPSTSNANFGFSVAHTEEHPSIPGLRICVFDYIHHWSPQDFEGNTIDYVKVVDDIWDILKGFPVDEFTTDQFSSGPIRSMLSDKIRTESRTLHKTPQIFEVTATASTNWKKAENFKTALNQGWIYAPYYEQADLELRFLRLVTTATTMRVEKQDTGPVTTKDVADTMFECVHALLGSQIDAMAQGLSHDPIRATLPGGVTPFQNVSQADAAVFQMLGGTGAARYRGGNGFGGSIDPARGIRRDNFGRPTRHR
jgi:hypothetical protein